MAPRPRYKLEVYLLLLRSQKEAQLDKMRRAQEALEIEKGKLQALSARKDALDSERLRWTRDYWRSLAEGKIAAFDSESRRNHLEGIAMDSRDIQLEIMSQDRAVRTAEAALASEQEAFLSVTNELKLHEQKKDSWLRGLAADADKKAQKEVEEMGRTKATHSSMEGWHHDEQ